MKKSKKGGIGKVIGVIILLVVVIVGWTILPKIFPFLSFVNKPDIPKPLIPQAGEPIKEEHITWLVNEIDGYKLETGSKIGMEITDTGEKFTTVIEDHIPSSNGGIDADADVVISGNREVILDLMTSEDMKTEIGTMAIEGKVSLEVKTELTDLFMKGYKSIYDSIQG